MDKITEYNVVVEGDLGVLIQEMAVQLKDGWQPYGRLQFVKIQKPYDGSVELRFYQPIVKYADPMSEFLGDAEAVWKDRTPPGGDRQVW